MRRHRLKAKEKLEAGTTDVVGSCQNLNTWIYELPNGIRMREVYIDSGKGGTPVEIMHLSDMHLNYMNERDKEEANPTLLSTYEHRTWGADGGFVSKNAQLLEYAKDVDQIMITGDVLDYLSHGAVELMYREIWNKYPDTIISVGNHDFVQNVQGLVEESLSEADRWKWIERVWKHDPHYYSKVIRDKVMVIQLNNAENRFYQSQVTRLMEDLKIAREQEYVVLLFMHEPLVTGNPADTAVEPILPDRDAVSGTYDFYTGKRWSNVYPSIDQDTRNMFRVIKANGDLIRGIFNGHIHTSFYTEILAETSDGRKTTIPQYTLCASAFHGGYALRITVK